MRFPATSVRVKGAVGFPVFDMRDGKEHAPLQLKQPTQFIGELRWNEYKERSCTGFSDGHEREFLRLVREARRKKERILWGSLHNYGVSINVAA